MKKAARQLLLEVKAEWKKKRKDYWREERRL
jgi:hypothetical protein